MYEAASTGLPPPEDQILDTPVVTCVVWKLSCQNTNVIYLLFFSTERVERYTDGMKIKLSHTTISVSYTHLDVYKRQVYHELRNDNEKFLNYFRLLISSFDELHSLLENNIHLQFKIHTTHSWYVLSLIHISCPV